MKKILVVEDDPDIRASIADLLQGEGYEVVTAHHGRDALVKLRSGELPGLVMLDLMMPEMDGYQLRAELLKDERLAKIPVLLMSAGGDLNAKARQLTVDGHLKKPFEDLDTILSTVARFF